MRFKKRHVHVPGISITLCGRSCDLYESTECTFDVVRSMQSQGKQEVLSFHSSDGHINHFCQTCIKILLSEIFV